MENEKRTGRMLRQSPEELKMQDEMAKKCGLSWNQWANDVLMLMVLGEKIK